jgi:GNAT superfamily N-acetyltransferase
VPNDRYRFEPLGEHNRAAFSCGTPELDRYFHEQAGQEMRRHVAAVWVLYDAADDLVAGYYTLSAASVEPTGLPSEVARKLPRYPSLPALLIGRLAVDERYRGQGLGGLLLMDALRRSRTLRQQLGIVAVIVDAKDEQARRFYQRYSFRRFAGDERRMFVLMATIAKLDLPE